MRASLQRLVRASRVARAVSEPGPAVAAASEMLLPPLPLYRALLRAHRRLIPEMRALGDDYVKSEFRRHQKIDNPLHIVAFCREWKEYLEALRADGIGGGQHDGKALDAGLLDRVRTGGKNCADDSSLTSSCTSCMS